MSLKLTIKPDEVFVINGCVIKNSSRRHTLTIENFADVIRGADLLEEKDANTPIKEVYYLIQVAFLEKSTRDNIIPHVQQKLAKLFTIFGPEAQKYIMECANYISTSDYYKALASLRPAIKYESKLLEINHVKQNI